MVKLNQLAAAHPGLDVRPATIESPLSLDHALAGASAVINCAGPFLDTASALIEAALRAQIHYLDVTAEQAAVREVFERFSDTARERGITVIPAMAFYGSGRPVGHTRSEIGRRRTKPGRGRAR
jgi:short subunit dehydrogenase-like uncharacterized protein